MKKTQLKLNKVQTQALAEWKSQGMGNFYFIVKMSRGKTILALEAIKTLAAKTILVIAPRNVINTGWKQDINNYYPDMPYYVYNSVKAVKYRGLTPFINLIPYEIAQNSQLEDLVSDLLIIDEAHCCAFDQTRRTAFVMRVAKLAKTVLCMSATPFRNDVSSVWTIAELLQVDHNLGLTIDDFKRNYGKVFEDTHYDIVTYDVPKVIKNFPKCFYFDNLEQDIPEVEVHYIPCKTPNISEIKKIVKFGMTSLVPLFKKPNSDINKNHCIMNLCNGYYKDHNDNIIQLDLGDKVDKIIEVCKSNGNHIVVTTLAGFRQIIREKLTKEFKNVIDITQAPSYSRAKIIQDWNDKKIKVLIMHPATLSLGVRLEKGGNSIIFANISNKVLDIIQSIGRLAREQSTYEKVFVKFFHTDKSVETSAIRKTKDLISKHLQYLENLNTFYQSEDRQ